jgi:hypothetical protein
VVISLITWRRFRNHQELAAYINRTVGWVVKSPKGIYHIKKLHFSVLQANKLAFLFICLFYSFIHMCVHCLGHFSPLPPAPTLSSPTPSLPGRTCSALISNFVEEKT